MSDFLTRMAQLSHGEATIVAPQLPSLFAPMEEEGPAETIETTPQQQSKAEPAAAPIDKDLPQSTTYVNRSVEQAISSKPQTGRENKTEETPTPLIVAKDNNHKNNKPVEPSIAAPLLTKVTAVQATKQQGISSSRTASPLLNAEPQTITHQTNVDMVFHSAINLNEQADSTMLQQSMPLVPGYKSKQAAPQQIMAELPAAEQSAQQEPTVHINIGRVEVRAHTAAPATIPRPAQRKPHSSLSLNDYLKRGGGHK